MFLAVNSCQMSEVPEMELIAETNEIVFLDADPEEKEAFSQFLTGDNPNSRLTSNYDPLKLVKISNRTYSRLAVSNKADPNTSLSFVVDPIKNQIDRAMISTSILNKDGSITSKMFSLDNRLIATFVHNPDGTLKETPVIHGFWKWFDKVDDCWGTVGAPFESNIANYAFEAVAIASTSGMWIPALAVVCLGVGTGQYYQN